MKTSIVPAQMTTVEDKVAGNISLLQLILLSAPIFVGTLLFVIVPPFLDVSIVKTVIMFLMTGVSWTLAVRINGRLVLDWVQMIGRYNLRPRYYVADKNSSFLRQAVPVKTAQTDPVPIRDATETVTAVPHTLLTPQIVRIESLITDPAANLKFNFDRKGVLRVNITKIK
jgi:hypothetical protein